MPPVQSTMLPIGTPAPPFSLPGADGALHDLDGCPTSHWVEAIDKNADGSKKKKFEGTGSDGLFNIKNIEGRPIFPA